MQRTLKDRLDIKRPFAIFIEEDDDFGAVKPCWIAHIVGYELDNVTFADTPADAVYMASDLIRMLTGGCKPMSNEPHDWSVDTFLHEDNGPDGGAAAWGCSKCGEMAAKTQFEE